MAPRPGPGPGLGPGPGPALALVLMRALALAFAAGTGLGRPFRCPHGAWYVEYDDGRSNDGWLMAGIAGDTYLL